jgi:aryl carrier-like protein
MYRPALSLIFRNVLKREEIADDDDLFALGVDSVQAIAILHRIRDEIGLTIELADIWKHPSIRALDAALLASPAPRSARHVPPAGPRDHYPVSPVQRGLCLMDGMARPEERQATPSVSVFDADLDPGIAETAFRQVLRRHEPLRTVFGFARGAPVQAVRPAEDMAQAFAYTDLGADPDPAATLRRLHEAAARQAFDLETGPLVRFHIVRTPPSRCIGLLTLHHIVSDDFSAATVENDFRRYYDAAAGRRVIAEGVPETRPLAFQYKDYVLWLEEWIRGPGGRRSLAYWTGALAGFTPPALFGTGRTTSFAAGRDDAPVPPEILARLSRCSAGLEATPFVVLLGCIRTLLFVETGHRDVAIGVAATTRDEVPLSGQIGPFVNTLPMRSRISGATTFRRLVADLEEARLEALAHKLLPVETLAEALPPGPPLFDVGFTLQKRRGPAGLEADLAGPRGGSDPLGIKLLFIAFESPSELVIRIRYQTARFSPEEIGRLRDRLMQVVGTVCAAVDTPFDELFEPARSEDMFSMELDLG